MPSGSAAGLAIVDKRRDTPHETRAGEHHRRSRSKAKSPSCSTTWSPPAARSPAPRQAQGSAAPRKSTSPSRTASSAAGAIEKINDSPITTLGVTDSIPLTQRKKIAQNQGPLRRPASGRSHQAHPPRSIDQHSVRSQRAISLRRFLLPRPHASLSRQPRCMSEVRREALPTQFASAFESQESLRPDFITPCPIEFWNLRGAGNLSRPRARPPSRAAPPYLTRIEPGR